MVEESMDKEVALDARARAPPAAKTKGMAGDHVEIAARDAAARVLSRALGKRIAPDDVAAVVGRV